MSQAPRTVTIGLSGEWLEQVGIPPEIHPTDLDEFIDTVVKDNPGIFEDEWRTYRDDIEADDDDDFTAAATAKYPDIAFTPSEEP